jgi:hypothetical protein
VVFAVSCNPEVTLPEAKSLDQRWHIDDRELDVTDPTWLVVVAVP